MLRFATGADWMPTTANATTILGQLGWYGLPGGSSPAFVSVDSTGRFGGKCFGMGNSHVAGGLNQASYLLKGGVTPNTWFQGNAIYVPSTRDLLKPFIGIAQTGTCLFCVAFSQFGVIELWQGRPAFGGSLIASSPPGAYTLDTWNYIEFGGYLVNSSAGYLNVRINTVPLISVVSHNTGTVSTVFNSFMFGYLVDAGAGDPGTGTAWDDIYLCDDQGSDNVDFLGNIRVRSQFPAGAGANTDFTIHGSQPTNWQAASNTAIDNSSYVFDANVGDYDLYTVSPISSSPTIFGVVIYGAYAQTDATQRSASNTLYSAGTIVDGVEYFTPGNFAFSVDIFERDPHTTLPWVYTDVNLIQIGPKVRS